MPISLQDKTINGVGWSALDNITKVAVTFIVSVALARILSPDDYGLIGITAIFNTICRALTDGGFVSALIRQREVAEEDYNTAFVSNLSISILLYIIILLGTPSISHFFGREELVLLIPVSSLGLIIGAVGFVPRARLTRYLDFKTQALVTLVASIISGFLGISMALFGFGVWALVSLGLVYQLVDSIGLILCSHRCLSFAFSYNSFQRLFGFGWKMMASQLINTTWAEMYLGVIAKCYSPALLGQYTRATQFSALFSSNLTRVVQRVSYPALSSIQDERERMVAAYRKMIRLTMFVTAIGMLFLGAISEPLLYCLIGPKWHEATMFLPILCLTGSLYPLHAFNLNMLQVKGRSDLFLFREIIEKGIEIVPILIGIYQGIIPMLYAGLLANVIEYFINSYISGRLTGYGPWSQIKDIFQPYIVAGIVFASVYFMKFLPVSFWIVLPLQMIVGLIVVYISCRVLRVKEMYDVYAISTVYFSKLNIKASR